MSTKLKEIFFSADFITELAESVHENDPQFDVNGFITAVQNDEWEAKELKERMRHISQCLNMFLPEDYAAALKILTHIAHRFKGFDAMVFPDYVQCYGLQHWELSLPALAYFTKFSSAEFAIRPFIKADPERAMKQMYVWSKDKDEHVRRLSSEGCRPRLPWAPALPFFKKNPQPILPILENLKADSADYVRRSVANNLNDISKDHPELVLNICEKWYGKKRETDWIVKHACRGLLKAGNARALVIFGYAAPEQIDILEYVIDKARYKVGETLQFEIKVKIGGKSSTKVRLEYAVYFVKSNGKESKKVFQIRETELAPGIHTVQKKHSFIDRTTRKHYAGNHAIAIIVNGIEKARQSVELVV